MPMTLIPNPNVTSDQADSKDSRAVERAGALADLLLEQDRGVYAPHISRIPAAAMRAWNLDRSRDYLERDPDRVFFIEERGEWKGSAAWMPLPWDSGLFGITAARLDWLVARGDYQNACRVKRKLLGRLLSGCRQAGIKHLTARSDAGDHSSIHSLEQAGFVLIDGIQTFGLCTDTACQTARVEETIKVGLFEPWQLDGVLEIARTAYRFDRFHSDPALSRAVADRIHQEWLRNSCSGGAADAVVVATANRQVLGFVTVRIDHALRELTGWGLATIVLVATAAGCRGRGIGRMTTLGALQWLRKQKIDYVQVGTQFSNVSAGRLYEGCGFRLIGASLTFRKLLDSPAEGGGFECQ